MWHVFPRGSEVRGATLPSVAPLLIEDVEIWHSWRDYEFKETYTAKVDTGASFTIIPKAAAIRMSLPSLGDSPPMRPFDQDHEPRKYPVYNARLFIPKWGEIKMNVVACRRDDILLGRDFCGKKLLAANWKRSAFGITPANLLHMPFKLFFIRCWRLRKVKL